MLVERGDIILSRRKHMISVRQSRKDNTKYYLDETPKFMLVS